MLKGNRLVTVQAVEKTLELLEMLADGSDIPNIRELASRLCLSRNEVLMLLVTLENRGMARWDDHDKLYRPGSKTAELAKQFLDISFEPVTDSRLFNPSRPAATASGRVRAKKMLTGRSNELRPQTAHTN